MKRCLLKLELISIIRTTTSRKKEPYVTNEYDILRSREGTKRYIRLINLLKKRDLIDGFGCQGHGLEDISIDTIKANLKLLETTGLPAYISEYDVNEADDSTQLAILMKQFMSFWEDPAVKGITFWGYIQDQTWRPSTYLVRADGSARPAFEWMEAYVSSHPTRVLHQEE